MPARLARLRVGSRDFERPPIHPVDVLHWLRNGILLCVAATAAMYLWVAIQAGSDIAAAQRTQQAITDLGAASSAVKAAGSALDYAFSREDPTLVGTASVLHPATFWWALLGPVIGFLLLAAATARVLARHFRRHVSPYLWGALLI